MGVRKKGALFPSVVFPPGLSLFTSLALRVERDKYIKKKYINHSPNTA